MSADAPPPKPGALPSTQRQKTFIVDNEAILDMATKRAILSLVLHEVGRVDTAGSETLPTDSRQGAGGEEIDLKIARPVILENATTLETSINLDNISDPDVVLRIYNIMKRRRAALNEPANSGKRR